MVFHDSACRFAPAQAVIIHTEQAPPLFPCLKGFTVQIPQGRGPHTCLRAFLSRKRHIPLYFALSESKGQRMGGLKAVRFQGSQVKAGTQRLKAFE